MKKLFGLFAVLALMGAGCAGTGSNSQPAETSEPTDIPAEAADTTPVPFSELEKNILEGDDVMGEYRYTHEEGTCAEQGAPEVVRYFEDPDLGYFIIESGDGEYREEWATGLANNTIKFDQVALESGEADCSIQIKFGEDSGTYVCTVEDEEVCSSTVSGVGIPRS